MKAIVKKVLATILMATASLGVSLTANADLIGASVTGTLAFGANGANGGQFWSPQNAVVGAGVEYFYMDSANTDTADFSATQVIITDIVNSGANGWKMTFSTSGGFTGLSLVSSNFDPGLTFSLAGGVLEFNWLGTQTGGVTYTAVFDVANTAAVPEPASLALLALGLAGLGLGRRKLAN